MRLCLGRFFGTSSKFFKKNYYEVLEVSPQATHSQIKTAYYKLSLMYHPDRNEGDSAKFQAITAAYEVLGNYNSRKLYDKGLTTIYEGVAAPGTAKPNDRHRMPTPSGRTVVYDFDEWSRAHYGETFARKSAAKERYERAYESKVSHSNNEKIEHIIIFISVFIFLIMFFSQYQQDLDVPLENKNSNKSSKP